MAEDYSWAVEMRRAGASIDDIKRRAREIKLERQGFKRDAGGGFVRPSAKPVVDPSPAQDPTFADKMDAFSQGGIAGLGAAAARGSETFAFGLPAKAMDAAGISSSEARERLKQEEPLSANLGGLSGYVLSSAAGPEAAIARGAQAVAGASRAAIPALAKTGAGRMASTAGESALAGGATAAAQGAAEGKSLPEIGSQAQEGALIGGALGGVVGGLGEAKRAIVGRAGDRLKERILNEVAETSGNRPSATTRKRLSKADENILNEVVHGPDADAVRNAYMGGAEKGRAQLGEILDGLGQQKDAAYEAFFQAGRSGVDPRDYLGRLEAMRKAEVVAGNTRKAKAIKAFADDVAATASETGGLLLPQLRQMTTQAQGHASSVLGSLHEHANAKVARQVEQAVTEAMDETLSAAAAGVPELEAAAQQIRATNQRFNALLSIDDAMKQRAFKEGSKQTGLMALAKDARQVGAGGAIVGGVAAGGAGAAAGMAGEALVKHGIPAAARAIDRGITSAAIRQARSGQVPGISSAARPTSAGVSILEARRREKERAESSPEYQARKARNR